MFSASPFFHWQLEWNYTLTEYSSLLLDYSTVYNVDNNCNQSSNIIEHEFKLFPSYLQLLATPLIPHN